MAAWLLSYFVGVGSLLVESVQKRYLKLILLFTITALLGEIDYCPKNYSSIIKPLPLTAFEKSS